MKLSVIANPDKYAVKEPLVTLLNWTEDHKTEVYCSNKLSEHIETDEFSYLHIAEDDEAAIDAGDIIVALGGDGTMLYTARASKNTRKPIVGINTGRLGFMANTQQNRLKEALQYLKEGNYRLDKRYMMEARTNDGTTHHALNEFLFSKKDSASMVLIEAQYNDQLVNRYWADGLIVASPTGSTAYNLSSFGPIVMPETDVLVLTPINPHTLTTRPLILPSNKPLKMHVQKQRNEVLFSYDGLVEEIEEYPFHVEIQRSNFTVELIELPGQSYFETLRSKLMWGKDFREHR